MKKPDLKRLVYAALERDLEEGSKSLVLKDLQERMIKEFSSFNAESVRVYVTTWLRLDMNR